MTEPVLAVDPARRTNAMLVRDAAALGHLDGTVVDLTWGRGRFWTAWRPQRLVSVDLHTRADVRADFTRLPFPDACFDAAVFDPPYKYNGTPTHAMDTGGGYGIDRPVTVTERDALIVAGCIEAARVASRRVLVKCQDQVVSGRKRWQTWIVADAMRDIGWRLVDRLEVWGARPQPAGRGQVHSRQVTSSLLIFAMGQR
jgi:hypothetical protein